MCDWCVGVYLVPESSKVLCISHGGIEASSEGNIDVEPDSRTAAHLQEEAHV